MPEISGHIDKRHFDVKVFNILPSLIEERISHVRLLAQRSSNMGLICCMHAYFTREVWKKQTVFCICLLTGWVRRKNYNDQCSDTCISIGRL